MNSKIERPYETMSGEELRAELDRLKDNLRDLEDTHSFTFGKTTVHIGAEQAQSMQEEYEQECRSYKDGIALIEVILRARVQS
jgi:hypothetical protein